MKTLVLRFAPTVMLILFASLSVCLAQQKEKNAASGTSVSELKAFDGTMELAYQSVDFEASEIFVMSDAKFEKNKAARDRNTFKNVESYPVPENGVELGSVVHGLITYPQEAIDQGIEGLVKVLCMVAKDGSVSSVVVLQDIGGNCAEEVCKAVKTIKFKPAMQNGYARRCNLVIPVNFDLTDYR